MGFGLNGQGEGLSQEATLGPRSLLRTEAPLWPHKAMDTLGGPHRATGPSEASTTPLSLDRDPSSPEGLEPSLLPPSHLPRDPKSLSPGPQSWRLTPPLSTLSLGFSPNTGRGNSPVACVR